MPYRKRKRRKAAIQPQPLAAAPQPPIGERGADREEHGKTVV